MLCGENTQKYGWRSSQHSNLVVFIVPFMLISTTQSEILMNCFHRFWPSLSPCWQLRTSFKFLRSEPTIVSIFWGVFLNFLSKPSILLSKHVEISTNFVKKMSVIELENWKIGIPLYVCDLNFNEGIYVWWKRIYWLQIANISRIYDTIYLIYLWSLVIFYILPMCFFFFRKSHKANQKHKFVLEFIYLCVAKAYQIVIIICIIYFFLFFFGPQFRVCLVRKNVIRQD